ncbi:unnamed protein product, partial [Owenia fusiformis]
PEINTWRLFSSSKLKVRPSDEKQKMGPKKDKKQKDADKANKKVEEPPPVEEKKEDIPPTPILEEIPSEPTPIPRTPTPREPTPEPVYEEPVLVSLVVTSYEGEKEKGLFEGEGFATFVGGHDYRGNFSQGMMHGQGVYTFGDRLVYEGEFLQNQITGKGTYKWPDGSIYEGDVLNGKRHGFGMFRTKNGKMTYSGDWCQGKRHGKGRMEFDPEANSYYEGDFDNNQRHGWGVRLYPSGNIYQGMWFNNVRHGVGTMRWHDKEQMYSGVWQNGVQHGVGQHIWFLHRVPGSQYPMRNMYDGDFVKGLRHGSGSFLYANGARYEGEWNNNMKHGKGKFVFKNGRVYEGTFDKDHILEFPNFTIDGSATPDLTQIRTRTPLPMENMSVQSNESKNTMGPTLQLELQHLLMELDDRDKEEESSQVMYVMMRHISGLRQVYNFYSALGYDDSPDNTFIMNRMQFWRFMKDSKFHTYGYTLTDIDRLLAKGNANIEPLDIHNPFGQILFREFVNYMIVIAYYLYHEDVEEIEEKSPILASCLVRLINQNIIKYSCKVKGYIYGETRRAVNALVHMDQAYEVYKALLSKRKVTPYDPTMRMREFLYMVKDYKLINADLTARAILEILSVDDHAVMDPEEAVNMDLEMTFLEFFEGLAGCAEVFVTEAVVKDPTTPRPSTVLTAEPSMLSMPGSPSRGASQGAFDEPPDTMTGHGSPPGGSASQMSSPVRATPSTTADKHDKQDIKQTEGQPSEHTSAGAEKRRPSMSRDSIKPPPEILASQGKSASLLSTHTPATEPQDVAPSVTSGTQIQKDLTLVESVTESDQKPPETNDGQVPGVTPQEDELDEQTRQFNFWTHQIHIFFVRKFFPAAEKLVILKDVVEKKYGQMVINS